MPRRVTIVKVPAGTPCPPGFTEGRTTRRGATCYKVEVTAAPAPAGAMFNMAGLAAALDDIAVPMAVDVPDEQVDALLAQLGGLGLGGRRRKTRSGKKAGRRTRRA